jgi:two-component system cell cycle response regulator
MNSPTPRILLIEDDPIDADFLFEILSEEPGAIFNTERVDRLQKGLERLAEGGVDLVLLDLFLPDSRGLETFTQAMAHASSVPIIVLTNLNDESLALEAVRRGAQDFLTKGRIDGPTLSRAIRYAIERLRLQETIRSLSLTDELTGLHNRRGFLTLAEQQLRWGRRKGGNCLLILADLDDFKKINDTFGHPEGDAALKKTAETLLHTFRQSDVVARIGGDEFAVLALVPDGAAQRRMPALLEKNIESLNAQKLKPYRLSLSVGVSEFDSQTSLSVEEMMAEADKKLYEQKRARHGR